MVFCSIVYNELKKIPWYSKILRKKNTTVLLQFTVQSILVDVGFSDLRFSLDQNIMKT